MSLLKRILNQSLYASKSKKMNEFLKLFFLRIFFSALLLSFCGAKAQDNKLMQNKTEKEERIRSVDFPASALVFLQKNFKNVKKIKFFREKTTDSVFFEAKFKYQKNTNSVKFFENGKFYDTEVEVQKKELEKEKLALIEAALGKLFFKFNIIKIQMQFLENQTFIGFEIEVKGFSEKEEGFFEINLDKFGNVYKTRKIEQNHPFAVYW
jgi:hypothetical protein